MIAINGLGRFLSFRAPQNGFNSSPSFSSRYWRVAAVPFMLLTFFGISINSNAVSVDAHPNLKKVVDELVAENVYTEQELQELIGGAVIQNKILDAMKNPAESKFTWGKYRKIFMQSERFADGAAFWAEHSEALSRAEQEYGVPAEYIVAIIAVESRFGKYKGSHRVLDALVSLIVDFPRRSAFFASELKHFLILAKENDFAIDEVKGSYAGAMGYPQFISSSYRHYAVDFSGDGKTDLIDTPSDAIGSIANYFVENGWLKDQPVVSNAVSTVPSAVKELASRKRAVKHTAQSLRELGAPVSASIPSDEKLNVLWLNAAEVVHDSSSTGLYLVRAGDTICQIAEAHSVSCRALMKLNKVDKSGKIYRGQQLKLPQSARVAQAVSKSPTSKSAETGSKWQLNNTTSNAKQVSEPARETQQQEVIDQYFFTHENFYVITRYNQSVLYAMAVHELAGSIRQEFERSNLSQLSN